VASHESHASYRHPWRARNRWSNCVIVNVLSAAIGHGGWGMIGANVLVNMTEVSAGYGTYKLLSKTKVSTFARAGTAVVIACSWEI